jgi:hypothetical protein
MHSYHYFALENKLQRREFDFGFARVRQVGVSQCSDGQHRESDTIQLYCGGCRFPRYQGNGESFFCSPAEVPKMQTLFNASFRFTSEPDRKEPTHV